MPLFSSPRFLIATFAALSLLVVMSAVADHTDKMSSLSNLAPISLLTDSARTTDEIALTGKEPAAALAAAPVSDSMSVMAWVYPGKASCNAIQEYTDGRKIAFLKPEYFTVAYDGSLTLLTAAQKGCNGYSAANAASIRNNSNFQYVTVSAGIDSMQALTESAENREEAIATLTKFVIDNRFTGVEIDFEDYGSWDRATYQNYLTFINELGDSLHDSDKKLMVDLPPISNATEQSYYVLKYSDMAKTNADFLVIMAYDYQFDQGAGTPIAPNAWVLGIIKNAKAAIPVNKLVIGIPSYAYSGTTGGYNITRKSYSDILKVAGIGNARRDASSGELIYTAGRNVHVFSDSQSLNAKRALIAGQGIKYISVWSLGGNLWF